jgi:hypothetical protein
MYRYILYIFPVLFLQDLILKQHHIPLKTDLRIVPAFEEDPMWEHPLTTCYKRDNSVLIL